MKPYKNAIQNLKQTLKTLTDKKRDLRREIHELKFTSGGERRPETGPQRDALWASYQWRGRPQARAAHIAYGLLRGLPYGVIEPVHTQKPLLPSLILATILAAFPAEEKVLKDEWTMDRVTSLLSREADRVAA